MEHTNQIQGFRAFATLIHALGTSKKTNDKLDVLVNYFLQAEEKDKVWTIAMFSGRKPKRFVSPRLLQLWCADIAGIPLWLFAECYHTVGDLSETIALLLPPPPIRELAPPEGKEATLSSYLETFIRLEKVDESAKKEFVTQAWQGQDAIERFVFNKLISGNFRIGISQQLVIQALAKATGQEPAEIAHRISGKWDPATTSFTQLINDTVLNIDSSKPYPFYLAYALEDEPSALGEPAEWQAEWKWDGIRGQIIKRDGGLFVWSRGGELMTDKFPEYDVLRELLPDGVCLDGEIICIAGGKTVFPETKATETVTGDAQGPSWKPLPFSYLQTRIGRKNISKKQLQEAPVGFIAYDLLEYEGKDYRQETMEKRRSVLENLLSGIGHPVIRLSPVVDFSNWQRLADTRQLSRDYNSEGIMLKRKSSPYQTGRKRGDWWKWKIAPLTIDAVLIYAQKGSGRRSNLYTDYSFAVKDGDKLVTVAKAYGGLTDKEFAQVDAFVKRNAVEKFGPVRTVKPELVFEIAFEGIAASKRHKSGVALRFPRMARWRKDKTVDEINTIDDLKQLLSVYGSKDSNSLDIGTA